MKRKAAGFNTFSFNLSLPCVREDRGQPTIVRTPEEARRGEIMVASGGLRG